MISVDSAYAPWVIGVVLAGMFTLLLVRALRRDRREYARFKRYRSTIRRQQMMRKWLVESFVLLGGSAIVLLAVAWRFVDPFLAAVERWPAMEWFREQIASGGGPVVGGIIGASVTLVVVAIASIFFVKPDEEVATVGDIHALLPRNREELKYGWGLSVNAGIVEELLFRLALPAALFAVTGHAAVSVGVSLVVFGAMHAYQGLAGIVGTFVFGLLHMVLFLATGSVLWAILAHALFDLRSLVLIPMRVYGVHRVRPRRIAPRVR